MKNEKNTDKRREAPARCSYCAIESIDIYFAIKKAGILNNNELITVDYKRKQQARFSAIFDRCVFLVVT